jgi:hypothetical protein
MLLKTLEREFFGYYEQHPKPCYLPWQPAGKSECGLQRLPGSIILAGGSG